MFVTGLATDFCIAWTALDARKAWKQMTEAGVKRIKAGGIA